MKKPEQRKVLSPAPGPESCLVCHYACCGSRQVEESEEENAQGIPKISQLKKDTALQESQGAHKTVERLGALDRR